MPHIEVRPARPEDQAAVLAFCKNTWEWGDYIDDDTWNNWLQDTQGCLLVATADEQPVGVSHLQMPTPTDGWIEGVRVDPAHRRQGIARALNEAAMLEAMRRNALYVRLDTSSTNTAMQQLVESQHMRRISAFVNYRTTPLTEPSKRAVSEHTQLATADDLDDIVHYLNVSNIFPLTGGLYYLGFTGYPITVEFLEEKIAAHAVYLLRRWDRLDGLAIAEPRHEWQEMRLSLGYIDGTAIEAISLIAYDLRLRSPELALESIRAYAPDLVLVHDAFAGTGYERAQDTYYIYERGLT